MTLNSLTLLKKFLSENNLQINLDYYLKKYIIQSDDLIDLPDNIIISILVDVYDFSNPIVAQISNYLSNNYDLFLGRIQKNQLKKYLDYNFEKDFEIFLNLIQQDLGENVNLRKIVDKFANEYQSKREEIVKIYFEKLNEAINKKNNERITDYLIFLYSRLLSFNEKRKLSLNEIFIDNEIEIIKELDKSDYKTLMEYCGDTTSIDRSEAISKFNKEYIRIFEHNGDYKEKSSIIYFTINQSIFDKFENKEKFYNYILSTIRKAYNRLQNHKSLIIRVKNIIENNINIKWELYSYITIFAEKFIAIEINRNFYMPESICMDVLEHKHNLVLNKSEMNYLKEFYDGKKTLMDLDFIEKFKNKNVKNTIEFFSKIYTGFSFIDCFILQNENEFQNSHEISFIKNYNELLLVFSKHKIDERKIPCPICGSLKISGNSYPEIGIKSWECKNPFCSERSKTNRGKRYSEKAILMQNANYDFSEENIIKKEKLKTWRKDIVESWTTEELYEMIVKHFSFVGDSITIVNAEDEKLFESIIKKQKRIGIIESYDNFIERDISDRIFSDFFKKSELFKQFLYKKDLENEKTLNLDEVYLQNEKIKLILGDSYEILSLLDENSIHNMVTSPPYYNAREYSQWKNLYNYLNDMYNIIIKAHHTLKKGGVFFFNIGDIFDNENTTIKSKMGEKRIPLGAYIIILFQEAGFRLLDNIIWYKGEPQSNRHKNDGNYTPYYQRPTNCYEHMFIFKKEGKLLLNKNRTKNILTNNIQKFTPVIKIDKDGENRYGHTAPFPKDVPIFSVLCFTNKKEFVLDPFSGSATTPIIANQMERIGIGIELNKVYFELSKERIKKENLDFLAIE